MKRWMMGLQYVVAAVTLLIVAGAGEALTFVLTPEEVRAAASVDADSLAETVRALSAIPSRVPGGGTRAAADYVRSRFEAAGLTDVQELPFSVTAPVQREAYLEAQGTRAPLYACWPNLVRTCTTPPEGIRGRLVTGGHGDYGDFDGKPIEGAIVALDYNCGRNWLNVPALGGRAVLFIEPDDTTHLESAAKFLRTPVNVPRFFITKEDWARVQPYLGDEVTVKARVDWEVIAEANIVGWVRGAGPYQDESIILSAYYDSMSVVPSLAPGAEQACGIAALIDLARHFSVNRPSRSVLFLATSGHGLFMQGIAEFFDRQMVDIGVEADLFVALDLASSGDRVGAFNAGHAYWDGTGATRLQALYAPLGTHLNELAHRTALLTGLYTREEYVAKGMERNPILSPFIESLTGTSLGKAGVGWANMLPEGAVHEAETAMLFGHLAYAFVTWGTDRSYVDSPLDTYGRFNKDNLAAQVRLLKPMLTEIVRNTRHGDGLITRFEDIVDWERQAHRAQFLPASGVNAGVVAGRVVEFVPKKNYIPDEPKTDALVVVRQEDANTYLGVRCEPIQRVHTMERNGRSVAACFRFPNIGRGVSGAFTARSREIDAYVLDPDSGDIVYVKDHGRNGEPTYPTRVFIRTTPQEVSRTVVVFPCRPVDVFDIFDPRYMQVLRTLRILDGRTDSEPESFGVAAAPLEGLYYESCATVFIRRKGETAHAFKLLGSAGIFGQRLVLVNATNDTPTGRGIDPGEGPVNRTPLRAARDLCFLNADRVRELTRTGILPQVTDEEEAGGGSLVMELHRDAVKELARADAAFAVRRYNEAMHAAQSAWALASRAYPLILNVKTDAVVSVLFYLALLLPAAYFLEKLLFGFPDIKRQIIGRVSLFFAVFVLLRFSNAAFGMAVNPYIVLLGFVMIALTLAVLRIIWAMFQSEMKRLRAQVTGIHNVEIGRSDAAGVAFGLGISSMRKRKLRTANTLITLVLLTFSVLSFTSIISRSKLKGRDLYDEQLRRVKASYEGVLFRSPLFDPINEDAYHYLVTEFREARTIAPRAWYPGGVKPSNTATRVDAVTGKTASVPAVLGLSAQEASVSLTNPAWLTGKWFSPNDRYAVLLTESLAKLLGLDASAVGCDVLRIWGRGFALRGILADDFFDKDTGFTDLDGEVLLPVNYALSAQVYQEVVSTRPDIVAQKPPPTFSRYDPLNTLVIPYETAMEMGGTLRSLAIVADDRESGPATGALQISEQFLRDRVLSKLATGLFAGINGLSYWYTSLGQADFRGLSSLIVLILIAALIVFNTILGSLYERQREIGIYTSLGLAPAHIGAFFLAESCVYAVLGCLFGYLLGQIVSVAKVHLGLTLLQRLTLDYSSASALVATLLVAGVVLASSLYPAWKAGRLSVPELERSVKLPTPVDDAMKLDFPFVFTGDAQVGIAAFLCRYLKDHEELATGAFHVQKTCLSTRAGTVRLECRVWLAPFDWGISQDVLFEVRVTGGEGALFLTLHRIEGEVKAWQRVNRRFVALIRRQFLIWRTLGAEHRKRYIAYGRRLLEGDTQAELEVVAIPD
jgi:hypothetical protein